MSTLQEYNELARKIVKLHKVFTSPDYKYIQYKDHFDIHGLRYKLLLEKCCFIYHRSADKSDYDDNPEFNYIEYFPEDEIEVSSLSTEGLIKYYPYHLYSPVIDEELYFQYSTIYDERELKMLVLYSYFDKHCSEGFYIQMEAFDVCVELYEKYYGAI